MAERPVLAFLPALTAAEHPGERGQGGSAHGPAKPLPDPGLAADLAREIDALAYLLIPGFGEPPGGPDPDPARITHQLSHLWGSSSRSLIMSAVCSFSSASSNSESPGWKRRSLVGQPPVVVGEPLHLRAGGGVLPLVGDRPEVDPDQQRIARPRRPDRLRARPGRPRSGARSTRPWRRSTGSPASRTEITLIGLNGSAEQRRCREHLLRLDGPAVRERDAIGAHRSEILMYGPRIALRLTRLTACCSSHELDGAQRHDGPRRRGRPPRPQRAGRRS